MAAKQKQKPLTRDDVRVEPVRHEVYDEHGRYIGTIERRTGPGWRWQAWEFAGKRGRARTQGSAIAALIRAENARRKEAR